MEQRATYRAPEVCALAGVTYRQLDYWCRTGRLAPVVPARGSGSIRAFSQREAQIAWVLGHIGRLGALAALPDLACLRELGSWGGFLVVHRSGVEHVAEPSELARWGPVAVVIVLAACPILDLGPLLEEVPA